MQTTKLLIIWALLGCFSLFAAISCDDADAQTTPTDTTAANRELGRIFYDEGFNAPTPAQLASTMTRIISPDYIQHNSIAPPGRDGLIGFISAVGQSFPDKKAIIRDVFATNDRVVVRWTFTGTLTGQPFLGIAAKGQKIEFDTIDIWTIKNGQLYEHWDQLDWPRAFVLLGIPGLPPPFVDAANKPVNR